jgi:hypothetical protein
VIYIIGQHPTPEKNSYAVMGFNFSGIDTSDGERFRFSFADNVCNTVRDFMQEHENFFPDAEEFYFCNFFVSFVPLCATFLKKLRTKARRTQGNKFYFILCVLCVSACNKKYISRRGAENAEEEFYCENYFSFFIFNAKQAKIRNIQNSFLQYFFNAEGAEGRKERKFFKISFLPIPRFPSFRVKK